ncbi:hypothetical protein E3U43_010451 [Larimichthys crocea]|uniref:Uncharacterized protein n=1 Tax=Larimichthys crocea TaxID=215358 RepID=A0ACD3RFK8_LARCR|nr:hypothetical protein E3U43_010451 [Larimichthys crocea]
MDCGVHLGILLMCLVQAEHVRCLWAAEAQSSQRQSGNRYVGFSQQDSGLKRFGGRYPQNQLRQAQSSSFNTDTAVSSSHSQGLSNRGYTQTLSQPAQSGHPSVKLVQSSLLSKPNSRPVKAQEVPKRKFTGLSTAIASGGSVSQYNKKQSDLTDISKKSTWPILQGTPRARKYPSSSSASVQIPSSESKLASHQVAQKVPSAAETQAYYGQRASPRKSSSLFNPVSPEQQKSPVQVKTSATARARKVSLSRGAKASKPSRFSSPQNERIRNNPSQTEAGNPYGSKLFPVTGKESYKPTSTSEQQNSRLGFQPRSLQRLSSKPSYTSTEQISSSTSSFQASWNSRSSAQGVPGNLLSSGSSQAGAPAKKFAPTRTHNIPQRFGGFSIRRLKEPADEKQVSIRKPQQTYTAPSQQSLNVRKPQQTYTAPSQPSLNVRKPQQTYTAPSQQSLNVRKPQQTYTAPSQQSVSLQPQAQSVHPQSTWKRIKPHSGK